MIRLFAPPTRDVVLRPDAVTLANLVLHAAVAVALLVPLGTAAKEQIFDRLVVYLIPPDQRGSRDRELGSPSIDAGALDAGRRDGSREVPADRSRAPTHGSVPTLTATDLIASEDIRPGDNALSVLEVDSAVVRDPLSAAPEYPRQLLAGGIEGLAQVRFVVDTTGVVDTITYRVVRATQPDFAVAVRMALTGMHFRPAIQGGQRVRQLVEQTFNFHIIPRDTAKP
jgi:TonB family protein